VRVPSPVGEYGTGESNECYFVCDAEFERKVRVCAPLVPVGVTHDITGETITVSDGTNSYTIMDRNL
jgi:hypothetical protein